MGKLEGFLGKKIEYLNPDRDFDFWLKEYNNFSSITTDKVVYSPLKLRPFELWVRPMLAAGHTVTSYVAIRADEEYREGYASKHKNLRIALPFRDNGIDKAAVGDILEASGVVGQNIINGGVALDVHSVSSNRN
ncbi:Uncharacterised protein [Escherichia coli]|uniref:Uncharacterized protein n=1 Tax=Escherichia coli TaxID=562 RepID=A0A376TN33_ECOLX|nr:Uncharacterised protein [Escherichia coli]